ncbi:MAG: type IV secretory system conjugative DNA transfer family protein [Brevibacterium sp.]
MSAEAPSSNGNAAAWAELIAAVVVAFLVWHVGLAMTTDLRLSDVKVTLDALKDFSPAAVAGNPASRWVPAAVIGLILMIGYTAFRMWFAIWWHRRRHGRGKSKGMSSGKELAQRIRGHKNAPTFVTPPLLKVDNKPIGLRAEDVGLILAPPRQMKTSAVAANQVLDAPGSVVATSIRADLMRLTITARKKRGPVWVLDLENLSGHPERATFPFIAGCEDAKVARERAAGMAAAIPLGGKDSGAHFADGVRAILRCLLHAAAVDRGTFKDVVRWSQNFRDETPAEILRTKSPNPEWANTLDRWMRDDNPDTIGNTKTSLDRVMDTFMDTSVSDQLSVEPGAEGAFDIDRFLSEPSTLYVIVDDEASASVAPVATAIVSSIVKETNVLSQKSETERLDPIVDLVLDEMVNICPLPALPKMMSSGGGRHLRTFGYLQGWSQAEQRWGKEGAQTIWDSAQMKLALTGLADDTLLEKFSRLIGHHWVTTQSHSESSGASGMSGSTQWNERRERIMEPEAIRKIDEGSAVLLYREKDAIATLMPWWDRPDAKELAAGRDAVKAQAWSKADD